MLSDSPLVYLFLYVRSLEEAAHYYREVVGLRVLEADAQAVKFDAGEVILALNRASDWQITLPGGPDDSSLIVFHVDDLDEARLSLERRGVEFTPTLRYEIGATTSFYDPDGHCITLYEPSSEAMEWPSAHKIRSILGAGSGRVPSGSHGAALADEAVRRREHPLRERKIVYLFLFVRDVAEARDFYHARLGLRILEDDGGAGVVKYDAGGLILSTHLVGGDAACAVDVNLASAKPLASVFQVASVADTYRELSARGVHFAAPPVQSTIGEVARFADPNGHAFFLYQPSDEALHWPSGAKLRHRANGERPSGAASSMGKESPPVTTDRAGAI